MMVSISVLVYNKLIFTSKDACFATSGESLNQYGKLLYSFYKILILQVVYQRHDQKHTMHTRDNIIEKNRNSRKHMISSFNATLKNVNLPLFHDTKLV